MELIQTLWQVIIAGGPPAIISLLFAAVVYLAWERQKLAKGIERYQKLLLDNRDQYSDSIMEIIDRYHKGNIELIQALNEIKTVLATMQKTMF